MQLESGAFIPVPWDQNSEDDSVVVPEEGRQVFDAIAGLPAQHRARRRRRRVPRVGTCRRSDTHTGRRRHSHSFIGEAKVTTKKRRNQEEYPPTTRECVWGAAKAVPFQLLLQDAAHRHPHAHVAAAEQQVRVRTRLVRGRGAGEVAADEKRVVGRRRQEQRRRQYWARRHPPGAGGGRRRHAVPNANGALQNSHVQRRRRWTGAEAQLVAADNGRAAGDLAHLPSRAAAGSCCFRLAARRRLALQLVPLDHAAQRVATLRNKNT